MSRTDEMLSGALYHFAKLNLAACPGNYFEIGSFNGVGTAMLAKHYVDKIIYAVDPFIEDGYTVDASGQEQGNEMLAQREAFAQHTNGLENVVLFETTSSQFADILTDEMIGSMNVQWVFIDGSHHYDDVVIDSDLAVRLIDKKPGVIVFDDMAHPDVRKAYEEFIVTYAGIITESQVYIGEDHARVVKINFPL